MRVAHLLPNLQVGGREKLANALAGQSERLGIASFLIGYDPPLPEAAVLEPAAPYVQIDRRDRKFSEQLRAILQSRAIDLVHAQGHIPACHLHAALAGMTNAPACLATVHVGLQGTRRWFWQIRSALRAMDGVSAVSHDLARTYARLSSRRVEVLGNGIDLGALSRHSTQWPSPTTPFRFAMVSRLAPSKRHVDAVVAADAVISSGHAIELHIAGEGECAPHLHTLATTRPWLRLAGPVDPVRFLRGKHGFLLPSRAEGAPLALIEAMAAGLPAIASDLPSLRSLAGDAATYVRVSGTADLAQAMTRLRVDAEFWEKQRLEAQRRARRFDICTVAEQYRAIYDRIGRPAGAIA